jgi:hypothetical protein
LVPYIHWLGAAVKKNANEVLGSGRRDRGRPKHQDSDLDSAKRWLQDQLQDGQPHSGKALLEAAKEGEGIKNFKLREAAKSLKVDIYKDGVAWFWRMPPVRATSATISQGEPSKRSGFLEVA